MVELSPFAHRIQLVSGLVAALIVLETRAERAELRTPEARI